MLDTMSESTGVRCTRTPVLSAMSALNASAQCGQDDMHGFAGRARIETHHPAKHSALEAEAAKSWRAGLTSGFQASCTGGSPVQRACNHIEGKVSHICGRIGLTVYRWRKQACCLDQVLITHGLESDKMAFDRTFYLLVQT